MFRSLLAMGVLCAACSGSSDASPSQPEGNGSCPDLSGAWDVTAHCYPSLIGESLLVTQNSCALSFGAPFDAFSGSVAVNGTITLSGPQSCTGTASTSAVSMNCTPDPCVVKLSR